MLEQLSRCSRLRVGFAGGAHLKSINTGMMNVGDGIQYRRW
jgi:hypothetical protein